MTESRLVSVIESREATSDDIRVESGYYADALGYYMGESVVEHLPDRSGLNMLEMFATIEWIKPILAKIFFGGPSMVRYTPKSAQDVEQAKQETDYVNHVILDQNEGFATIMSWFSDAMINRNGYVFAYWDKRIDTTESVYEGLTLAQVSEIKNDPKNEILEATVTEYPGPQGIEEAYTIKVIERTPTGHVCFDTVPPERVRIDAGWRKMTLHRCPFVQYYEEKTISELREAGFEVDDNIQDDDHDEGYAREVDNARQGRDGNTLTDAETDDLDPASRKVTVRTSFIRVDFDGDGIAELRRVIMIGKTILYNEPDDIVTIAALSPIMIPHRHSGLGFYDILRQIQDLKTQLARGLVDNVHLANNGRWFLTDSVDMDDFLDSRPNAPVRVDAQSVAGQAQPFNHPLLGNQIIGVMEYADTLTENWTGASPRSLQGQTFDGNSINKTASGLSQIMSAAVARIELIARMFAETGMRDLFRIIHALTQQHDQKKHMVELRGKWVEVDPTTWESRDNISVDTGLGTGDRSQKIQTLQALITAQTGLRTAGSPVVDDQRIYNALAKLTEEMGYVDPSEFWINPSEQQDQPKGLEALPPDQRQLVMQQINEMAQKYADAEIAKVKDEAAARGIEADLTKAVISSETQEAISMRDAMLKMVLATMESDDSKLEQGAQVVESDGSELQPAAPKQKRVVHNYDAQGRIISSDLVEA